MPVYGKIFYENILKSTIKEDFEKKGKKYLKDFKRIKITYSIKERYRSTLKLLKHVDGGEIDNAYLYFDNNNPVCLISVQNDIYIRGDIIRNISAIEIVKEYRGYGLSNQLLDVAVKELRANALCVDKDNNLAKQIYEKYGFVVSKESEKKVKSGEQDYYFMYLPGGTIKDK